MSTLSRERTRVLRAKMESSSLNDLHSVEEYLKALRIVAYQTGVSLREGHSKSLLVTAGTLAKVVKSLEDLGHSGLSRHISSYCVHNQQSGDTVRVSAGAIGEWIGWIHYIGESHSRDRQSSRPSKPPTQQSPVGRNGIRQLPDKIQW